MRKARLILTKEDNTIFIKIQDTKEKGNFLKFYFYFDFNNKDFNFGKLVEDIALCISKVEDEYEIKIINRYEYIENLFEIYESIEGEKVVS